MLAKESSMDPVISTVMWHVKEGGPYVTDSKDMLHYKKLEDSLIKENGCLLLGAGVVILAKLRNQVLQLLHLGHFGM